RTMWTKAELRIPGFSFSTSRCLVTVGNRGYQSYAKSVADEVMPVRRRIIRQFRDEEKSFASRSRGRSGRSARLNQGHKDRGGSSSSKKAQAHFQHALLC